ncbi:hypothetical protein HDU96_008176 [Phlyctochytrium bullatum]|nr:hypothetical protein HDU96_008176 [Phlyctochytrium bullatum]
MEFLVRELALAILLHVPPRDVAELLLVSHRIRRRFMFSPEHHKLARQHLQRHGDLESYTIQCDKAESRYRFGIAPFSRLPLAYSLAYLSWKGFGKVTILSTFPYMIEDSGKFFTDWGNEKEPETYSWDKPLQYPQRVEKFLRKAIELRIAMDVDDENPFVFHLVGKLDSVELMEAIIELGLRCSEPTLRLERRTALEVAAMHGACLAGAANIARHLLSVSSADLRNGLYKTRFPLYTLASEGHANVMQVLFEPVDGVVPEIDVERKQWNSTPLEWAVEFNNISAALFLLEHGADIKKFWLLSKAVWYANIVLKGADLASNRGSTRNSGMARLLIEHGAAIDDTEECYFRPLHYAIYLDDFETFELLLLAGADPISQGVHARGFTVLHFAVGAGRLEMVKHLYSIEAVKSQVFKEVGHGVTLLMYAAFHYRLEVVEWLLKHGGWAAFASATDADGKTALQYTKHEANMKTWCTGIMPFRDGRHAKITTEYETDEHSGRLLAEAVIALLLQHGAA